MTDDLGNTLREVTIRLAAQAIPYMVVGSVAALAHGRSRSTHDCDLVFDSDPARLQRFVATLPEERFYASAEAAAEAYLHTSQFNVIDLTTGWKIDLIVKKQRPFSTAEFGRRQRVDLLDVPIFVATVEDTILSKLEWSQLAGGSERQLEDVRALVTTAGPKLDRAYVEQWLDALGVRAAWDSVQS